MGKFKKVTVGELDKNEIWVSCAECNQETLHKVHSSIHVSNETSGESFESIQTHDDYLTIECNGCKTVSFCSESTCSEDIEPDEKGGINYIVTRRLYPSRIVGRPKMEKMFSLPHEIRGIYEETHAALCSDHRILASIGLRAIIESVCKDQKAKGNNLEAKIDDLVKKDFITSRSAKILQDLRFMGNKAAHEVKAHSESVLKIALDITEHLLKEIYILSDMAGDLPKK